MKKVLFSLLGATALVCSTSCSDDAVAPELGGKMKAKFNVSLSDEGAASRAISDGLSVDKLYYEVYTNVDGKKTLTGIDEVVDLQEINGKKCATVEFELVKGQAFDIVFWAQKDGAYDAKNLTNIPVNWAKCNDETKDAFTAVYRHEEVKGSFEENITLYRPFAQINFGTPLTDIAAARKSGATIETSEITVGYAAESYNALAEKGEGEKVYTFALADMPNTTEEELVVGDAHYEYLATTYVMLPGYANEKVAADIIMTVPTGLNKDITLLVANAPQQRNYRTNILGNLLTDQGKFNVVVDKDFNEPDNNVVGGEVIALEGIIAEYNAQGVEEATITINKGSVATWTTGAAIGSTPFASEGSKLKKLTIKGEGTFKALGKGVGAIRLNDEGGLVVFDGVTIADESVSYAENAWEYGYLEFGGNVEFYNCTIDNAIMLEGASAKFENCQFNGKSSRGANIDSEYAAWVSDGVANFVNCTFGPTYRGLKMHEAYGSEIAKVVVDGCTFTNLSKKPGIAIGDLNAETQVIIKNSVFEGCQAGDQGIYAYETDTDLETINFTYENNVVKVSSVETLQAALDNAPKGDHTFMLAKDMQGNFTVVQKEGVNITIDGDQKKFDGVITVNGNARAKGAETLKFKNINFETAQNDITFITAPTKVDGRYNYSHNVTVEACTFSGNQTVGSANLNTTYNFVMKNCVANNMHSLLQVQSVDNTVLVENVEVKNSKNGISFGNAANATLRNAVIATAGYGVRADGHKDRTLVNIALENVKINAFIPVAVRKVTENTNVAVAMTGVNELTKGGLYHVAIATNEYEEGVTPTAPAGTWAVTGADDYLVFPREKAATTQDELQAFLDNATANSTIIMAEGNLGAVTLGKLNGVTIEGSGNSVVTIKTDADTELENVTVKNVKFVYDGTDVNSGIVVDATAQIDNLLVEGCNFVGIGAKAGRGIYGQNPNATIKIKGCNFKDLGYPIYTMSGGGYKALTVEACTFEGIRSWAIMPQYNDYAGDMTVTNNKFINCVGGLVKAGNFTADHTFTFTNNTVTNSAEHPAKNWFTINTAAASKVVSGNTKDGQAWEPGEAEGLK